MPSTAVLFQESSSPASSRRDSDDSPAAAQKHKQAASSNDSSRDVNAITLHVAQTCAAAARRTNKMHVVNLDAREKANWSLAPESRLGGKSPSAGAALCGLEKWLWNFWLRLCLF